MPHGGVAGLEMTDTSARAEERCFQRLRETPPRERPRLALRLSGRVRAATLSDVRRPLQRALGDRFYVDDE